MKAKLIIVALFIFLAAVGCSPRIIEHVRTEIEYRDRYVRDSLYLRDSIYIKEQVKGDTVYVSKYVDRWRYRDRFVHDTTFVAMHDTTEVVKEVPAKLTKWQQGNLDSYGWLVAIIIGLLVWIFRKPLLALIKRLVGLF